MGDCIDVWVLYVKVMVIVIFCMRQKFNISQWGIFVYFLVVLEGFLIKCNLLKFIIFF